MAGDGRPGVHPKPQSSNDNHGGSNADKHNNPPPTPVAGDGHNDVHPNNHNSTPPAQAGDDRTTTAKGSVKAQLLGTIIRLQQLQTPTENPPLRLVEGIEADQYDLDERATPEPAAGSTTAIFYCEETGTTTLPLFIPAKINAGTGRQHSTRILADTGSGESFILRSLAEELGLDMHTTTEFAYSGVVGNSRATTTTMCQVHMHFGPRTTLRVQAYVVDAFPTAFLWGRNGMRQDDGNGISINPDPDNPEITFGNGHIVSGELAPGTPGSAASVCTVTPETTLPAQSRGIVHLQTTAAPGTHVLIPESELSPTVRVQMTLATVNKNGAVAAILVNTAEAPVWNPAGFEIWGTTTTMPQVMEADAVIANVNRTDTEHPPTASSKRPADGRPTSDTGLKKGTSWSAEAQAEEDYEDGAIAAADLPALLDSLIDNATATMTKEQRIEAKQILHDNIGVFSTREDKVGKIEGHEISFKHEGGNRAIFVPPRRMAPNKAAEATRQVEQLLAEDVIQPTTSGFNFPLLLISKGKNRAPRLALDLREFNASLLGEWYPIPAVKEVLGTLAGSKIFSTVDATSAFHMVPLSSTDGKVPSDQRLCFTLPDGRRFSYRRLPFGVKDASFSFSRILNSILRSMASTTCIYLDDATLHTECVKTHLIALRLTLEKLRDANVRLTPHKCAFLQTKVAVLGHKVSHGLVELDSDKVQAVRDLRAPTNRDELARVYGLLGWARRFLPDFAARAKPLSDLLKGDGRWDPKAWTGLQEQAFEDLKRALCSTPVLAAPDFTKEFTVFTDASKNAIAGVLMQADDSGKLHPVEYYSRLLNSSEVKYSMPEKECFAVVQSVERFRWYLLYAKEEFVLKVRTDHAGLCSLYKKSDESSRIFNWAQQLSKYRHKITWHSAKCAAAAVPDALTRVYLALTEPGTTMPNMQADLYGDKEIRAVTDMHMVTTGDWIIDPETWGNITTTATTVVAAVSTRAQKATRETWTIDHLVLPATSPTGTPGFRVRWKRFEAKDDTYEFTRQLKADMTTVSWQTLLADFYRRAPPEGIPMITRASGTKRSWTQDTHPNGRHHAPVPALDQLPEPFPTADQHSVDAATIKQRLLHKQLGVTDIVKTQQTDELCKAVTAILQKRAKDDDTPPMIQRYANSLAEECELDSKTQLLTRNFTWRAGPRKGHQLRVMVLPEHLVPRVLHQCHDCLGHLGRDALLWYCQSRFFFSKMRRRIERYIKSCDQCVRTNRDRRPAPWGHVASTGLNSSIGIDFAGPFKAIGTDGCQHLAIITDHHSKFLYVAATRACSAADAIEQLRRWVEQTGSFPKRIFSDRGAFARSTLYQDFLQSFGIRAQLTVSLNPQGNAASECQVKNIKRILKRICIDHPFGWGPAARYAALTYNQSYHTTIGTSPYFARHGEHPRTISDVVLGSEPPSETGWASSISVRRTEIDKHIADAMAQLGSSYERRNAALRGTRKFNVGDTVYLHQVYPASFERCGTDVKLFPAFRPELFEVIEVVSPQLCRIKEIGPNNGFNDIVHIQRLKPFQPREDAISFDDFIDPRDTSDSEIVHA